MSLHSSKPAANSDLFSSHIWPKQWWQILILVKSVGEDKKKPDIVISCYSHIRPKHWYWNQALVQSVAEIRNTNLQLGVWFSFSVWCRTTSDRKLKSDPECFKICFCRRFDFFLSCFAFLEKGVWVDFSFLSCSFVSIIPYAANLFREKKIVVFLFLLFYIMPFQTWKNGAWIDFSLLSGSFAKSMQYF